MGISKSQLGAMVVNGLLILFGILMVALAFHLINEHHMTSLYFLSSWLYTFPMTLIILGMFNVVIAFAAIIAASIRNKYGLIVCAIFVLLLVLPQFFSIWAANRVKEDTDEKAFLQPLFTEKLSNHIVEAIRKNDNKSLDSWYMLQKDLRCCGSGNTGNYHGYDFWSREAKMDSLPKTCCLMDSYGEPVQTCRWKNFFINLKNYNTMDCSDQVKQAMFRIGCMSILDHLYNFEVLPLLNPGYFIISILAALLQLLSAATLLLITYTDKLKKNYA